MTPHLPAQPNSPPASQPDHGNLALDVVFLADADAEPLRTVSRASFPITCYVVARHDGRTQLSLVIEQLGVGMSEAIDFSLGAVPASGEEIAVTIDAFDRRSIPVSRVAFIFFADGIAIERVELPAILPRDLDEPTVESITQAPPIQVRPTAAMPEPTPEPTPEVAPPAPLAPEPKAVASPAPVAEAPSPAVMHAAPIASATPTAPDALPAEPVVATPPPAPQALSVPTALTPAPYIAAAPAHDSASLDGAASSGDHSPAPAVQVGDAQSPAEVELPQAASGAQQDRTAPQPALKAASSPTVEAVTPPSSSESDAPVDRASARMLAAQKVVGHLEQLRDRLASAAMRLAAMADLAATEQPGTNPATVDALRATAWQVRNEATSLAAQLQSLDVSEKKPRDRATGR